METALQRTTRLAVLAIALAAVAACGGDANEQGAATTDTAGGAAAGAIGGGVNAAGNVEPQEAIAFMAAADQSEVQAAQVAVNKATNAEVREFARLMQREHSRSARQIGALATRMNVNLESGGQQGQTVQNLQQMAQQTMQRLNSTPKGAEFDRAYMESQVQAHQTVLENLQRIAGGGGATGTGAAGAGTPGAGTPGAGTPGAGTPGAGATTTPPARPPGGAGTDTTQTPASPQAAAQAMIPHVQHHLERARQIQSRLSGGAR